MESQLENQEAFYFLDTQNEDNDIQRIAFNELLDQEITIQFLNEIKCIHCDRITRKSFNQGFCYPCSQTAPEASPSIVKPELDQSHLGISRDMEWAKKYSLVDHYVYLAVSSSLKVGITRHSQIPTRWIDQGATSAIKIAKVPYRNLSGLIEVELKKHYADKTNWRKMLSSQTLNIDLVAEREKAQALLPEEYQQYIYKEEEVTEIRYPVIAFPEKIKSLNLDKTPSYQGILKGIKGQYLIFEDGTVFNVRKHTGYKVSLTF